jgi:hypothetical protein
LTWPIRISYIADGTRHSNPPPGGIAAEMAPFVAVGRPMTIRNTDQLDRPDSAEFDRHEESPPRDECCRSGCTVCILDYPDAIPARDAVRVQATGTEISPSPLISSDEVDQQLLDMLEAFERAEAIVAALVEKEPESVMPNEGDH